MDKKNSEDNDGNCDSQFNDNETEEDGPSGEISKGKPKLSFGMSRILDDSDNDDCDDSDAEINVQDDDEEVNKKPAKKSAKNSETKFYNTIPHPYPPGTGNDVRTVWDFAAIRRTRPQTTPYFTYADVI